MSIDQIILDKINRCELHVCWQTLDVHFRRPGTSLWKRKVPSKRDRRGRIGYVFNVGGKVRTIYRNRLFFLYFKRRPPEGVVDHEDGDRTNDCPTNLREMSKTESNRQGLVRQEQNASLGEAGEYFDMIAFLGYAPE